MRAFSSDSDVSRFLVDHASAYLTQTEGKTPTPDDDVIVDGTPVDIEVCVCVCVCASTFSRSEKDHLQDCCKFTHAHLAQTEAAAPTDIDANAEVFQELQTIVE